MKPAEAPFAGRVARAFGDTIARLHARIGGDPSASRIVERWAQQLWSDADAGPVCGEVADDDERRQLGASPVVDVAPGVRLLTAMKMVIILLQMTFPEINTRLPET